MRKRVVKTRSKLCAFCGTRFLPTAPQQRYCPAPKTCRGKMAYQRKKAEKEERQGTDPVFLETQMANQRELAGFRTVKLLSLGEKTARVDYHGALFVIPRETVIGIIHEGKVIKGEFT